MSSKKKPAAKAAAKKQAAPKKATAGASSVATAVQAAKAREQADLAFARLTNAQAQELELKNAQTEQRLRYERGDDLVGFSEPVSKAPTANVSSLGSSNRAPEALDVTLPLALVEQEQCIEFNSDLLKTLEQKLAPLLRPVINASGGGSDPVAEPVMSDVTRAVRSHTARVSLANLRMMALIDRIDLGSTYGST